MTQATLIVKTDPRLKKQTQQLAESFGLSMNAIINGFMRRFVEERHIAFSAPDHMTPALERSLRKSLAAEKKYGSKVLHRVENVKELKAYLDSIV